MLSEPCPKLVLCWAASLNHGDCINLRLHSSRPYTLEFWMTGEQTPFGGLFKTATIKPLSQSGFCVFQALQACFWPLLHTLDFATNTERSTRHLVHTETFQKLQWQYKKDLSESHDFARDYYLWLVTCASETFNQVSNRWVPVIFFSGCETTTFHIKWEEEKGCVSQFEMPVKEPDSWCLIIMSAFLSRKMSPQDTIAQTEVKVICTIAQTSLNFNCLHNRAWVSK